ncbi:MAG: NTE family protein RssA [Syntrophaceae bacterium PtaB.Bin095]|jgi:NTE family protein|nr:MAG: NTE family protein RssA [Syntrophaceae bacterium PtaB.Bin095]
MAARIGLALGSGSARGLAHIGVIRRLQEEGIGIDLVCGTSIGAVVAGAYAADFLDSMDNWVREMTWSDILGFMDVTVPRSGLIEGGKIIQYFRENLSDSRIEDLPVPFGAVATDLKTGKEIWLQKGSLMDAMRGSMSLPGILTPFLREGQWLVDGGLVNPVPVSLCRAMGADLVIAVNLNSDIMGKPRFSRVPGQPPPEEAAPEDLPLPKKLAAFFNGRLKGAKISLLKRFGPSQTDRGPSLFEVIAMSINIMQDRITRQRLAGEPPDVLVSPRLNHVGLLEFNRAAETIEEGRRAMERMMPLLRDMLE